jgi:hypothetical protein
LHGDPKVKVTRRSVCLPQQVAFTLGSLSATIAVQGYTRAGRHANACDHCAKERPQPRDAHPTEHPFPAQSDPQVAFARSFNRRHHRRQRAPATRYRGGHGRFRRYFMLREVGRDRDQLCEAALEVEQLHCGNLFGRGDEAGGLVQDLNGLGRARAGAPYRFTVRAKDGSPLCDIFPVLQPSRDLEFGAQEGGSEFGDEFLERVGIITEAFAEFAREAVCSAAPVTVMPTSA